MPAGLSTAHSLDCLFGRQHMIRHESIVGQGRSVSIPQLRRDGSGRGVFDYRNLEALLQQFSQMALRVGPTGSKWL